MGSTDIFNYLVLSSSFCTRERFKAYKSMDAYAVLGQVSEKKYVVLGQVSDCITNVQLQKGYIYILFIYLVQCYIVNLFCLHVQVRHSQ